MHETVLVRHLLTDPEVYQNYKSITGIEQCGDTGTGILILRRFGDFLILIPVLFVGVRIISIIKEIT